MGSLPVPTAEPRPVLNTSAQLFTLRLIALLTVIVYVEYFQLFINFLIIFVVTHVNTREKRGFKILIVALQVGS